MSARSMNLGLCAVSPQPLENAIEARAAALCGLHRHCLAHNGASARDDLEV